MVGWLLVMVGLVAVTRFARVPSSPVMWQQWAHASQFHVRLTAPLVAAVVAYRTSANWLRPTRLVVGVTPRPGRHGIVFVADVVPPIVGLVGALGIASAEFWIRATDSGLDLFAPLVATGPSTWTVVELPRDELACEPGPPLVCLAPSWAAIAPEVRRVATAVTEPFWKDLGRPYEILHLPPTSALARSFTAHGGSLYPLVYEPTPGAGFEPAALAWMMAARLSGIYDCADEGRGSVFRERIAVALLERAGFPPPERSEQALPPLANAEVVRFLNRTWTATGLDCLA